MLLFLPLLPISLTHTPLFRLRSRSHSLAPSPSRLLSSGSTSTSWTTAKSEVFTRLQASLSPRPTSLQNPNLPSTLNKVFFSSMCLCTSPLPRCSSYPPHPFLTDGGASFGCCFRPKTVAVDLTMPSSTIRSVSVFHLCSASPRPDPFFPLPFLYHSIKTK